MSHHVAILAYDGLCTFEFGCAIELFALERPELGVTWYDDAVCSAEPGPLRAASQRGARICSTGAARPRTGATWNGW
jgi:hypothetical protein